MGITVGLAVGVAAGQAPVVLVADFGLVVGAIAGATLRPYLRLLSLPVVLLGRILPARYRRPLIAVAATAPRLRRSRARA